MPSTWPERIDELAAAHPDAPALTTVGAVGETLSWQALSGRSAALAGEFASRGARAGSVVVVQLPNGQDHVLSSIAAWRLGATVLPLRPGLPDSELQRLLALASPSLVVGNASDAEGALCGPQVGQGGAERAGSSGHVVADPAWMIGSGGSTGSPKLIAPPINTELGSAGMSVDGGGIVLADASQHRHPAHLVCAPLSHTHAFSLLYRTLLQDYRIVLTDHFEPEHVLDVIEQERIAFVGLVPTMLLRLLRSPTIRERDLSSLECVLQGAAACPDWVIRAWISLVGPDRFLIGYGSSEGVGSARIRGDEWLAHPGSVGRPWGCEVRILDPNGVDVGPGVVGELFFRTPGSVRRFRYVGAPPAREAAGGYVSVGDLGRIDDEGYLYIADRREDMVVTGGANVYVAEVEAVVLEHPDVEDAAVIGLSDPEWGRRVHALIQPRSQPPPLTLVEELRTRCKHRLAPYKVPKTFEIVHDLGRTEAGKLNRRALVAARDQADTDTSPHPHLPRQPHRYPKKEDYHDGSL